MCGGEFIGKPTELLSNHGYMSYKVYILIPVGDGCSYEVSVYSCWTRRSLSLRGLLRLPTTGGTLGSGFSASRTSDADVCVWVWGTE